MLKRNTRTSSLALVALLLAGCGGGGGSDTTAVSANPADPPAAEPSPSPGQSPIPPAPGKRPDEPAAGPAPVPPAPTPGQPAPAPGPVEPSPAPAPAAPSVSGMLVFSALLQGISTDPAPTSPVTNYRRISAADGSYIHLGGSLESHSFSQAPWGAILREGLVNVRIIGSDGVIDRVIANDMTMSGPQLDLRTINPEIDKGVQSWSNGEWSVQLIVQSDSGPDRVRICWNVNLPPPPPVAGPPGQPTVVYTVPLRRLMCGVYARSTPARDVGGHVEDDFNGTRRTFRASW